MPGWSRRIATADIGDVTGDHYILGTIAADASAMTPSGTAVDGTLALSKTVRTDVSVPVQNTDDSEPAFDQTDSSQEEGAPAPAPAIAGDDTSFKPLDISDSTATVANGTYQFTFNGVAWTVTVTTGAASIAMGDVGKNTLAITLAEGARSVADLINLFIPGGGATTDLTVAELARLGLTTGATPDAAQDAAAITAAIQQAPGLFRRRERQPDHHP